MQMGKVCGLAPQKNKTEREKPALLQGRVFIFGVLETGNKWFERLFAPKDMADIFKRYHYQRAVLCRERGTR